MAWTVDIAFNQAYTTVLDTLYQSDPMEIRSAVRVETGVIGKSKNFERLSGVNMVPVTSRHQATPHTPMTHSRRRATLVDYAANEYIDDLDKVKMLISPQSEYTQNFVSAWNRRIGKSVTAAALGNAVSVDEAETTANVALPSSQVIANGGTNMTFAKVRQARRILGNAGVPSTDLWACVSWFAIEKLLSDSIVTSSDFSSLNALAAGTFPPGTKWMGFQWIVVPDADPDDTSLTPDSTWVLPKTGNIRKCLFWHKSALGLAIGKDFSAEVSPRADLMNSTQVLVKTSLGGTRILDFGVVEVDIDESA